jgi:hypothetical protein
MVNTAKAKPTANTGAKVKKSTIRGKGKSNTNELPSSPRSRADRAAHRAALLNPTDVVELNPTNVELNPTDVELNDVVDPALSAVNPSVSEINYGVLSPARATRSQAKNGIGDNNICDNAVDEGIDLAYDSDSDDEDYRGDVYEDDYSDGEESLGQYRVPSARGRGAGRKPKAGRPPKPDTKGMSARDAYAATTDWGKNGRGTRTPIGVPLLLRQHSGISMKVWTHPVTSLRVFAAQLLGK